jgi:hypothetical protein
VFKAVYGFRGKKRVSWGCGNRFMEHMALELGLWVCPVLV